MLSLRGAPDSARAIGPMVQLLETVAFSLRTWDTGRSTMNRTGGRNTDAESPTSTALARTPSRLLAPGLTLTISFVLVYLAPEDRHFGRQLHNGTWNGIVGMLQSQEADMSGVALMMSPDRIPVVDGGESVLPVYISIAHARPTPEADMIGFIKPFTIQPGSREGFRWLPSPLNQLPALTRRCEAPEPRVLAKSSRQAPAGPSHRRFPPEHHILKMADLVVSPLSLLTCQLIGPFSLLMCPLSLSLTVHCHFLPHTGQHGSNQVHLARFNFTRAALGSSWRPSCDSMMTHRLSLLTTQQEIASVADTPPLPPPLPADKVRGAGRANTPVVCGVTPLPDQRYYPWLTNQF
ncbi:hypothetical protein O3P69_006232 [Scylla paramamosain]|uniref:Uncharacterized protein n=1 Tax=Scylla paramamosain TaxID=85552 RepID=A0AAW0U947_SCYPA